MKEEMYVTAVMPWKMKGVTGNMKRIKGMLILFVILLMAGRCAAGEAVTENLQEEAVTEGMVNGFVGGGMLMGGWSVTTDSAITDEAAAAFEKAMEKIVGVDYEPIALLATQLVAGTNYCFLCRGTVVVPDALPEYMMVYIYEDLDGNAQMLEVHPISFGLTDGMTEVAGSGEVPTDTSVGGVLAQAAADESVLEESTDLPQDAAEAVGAAALEAAPAAEETADAAVDAVTAEETAPDDISAGETVDDAADETPQAAHFTIPQPDEDSFREGTGILDVMLYTLSAQDGQIYGWDYRGYAINEGDQIPLGGANEVVITITKADSTGISFTASIPLSKEQGGSEETEFTLDDAEDLWLYDCNCGDVVCGYYFQIPTVE